MRRLFATLALVAFAACGDNSSTGTTTVDLIGSWRLQSVNGNAIPYTNETSVRKLEVLTGSLVISDGGTYTATLTERITPAGGSANILIVTTYGTVELGGQGLVFKRQDIANDPGTTAALTSTTLGFTQDDLVLVFVKN